MSLVVQYCIIITHYYEIKTKILISNLSIIDADLSAGLDNMFDSMTTSIRMAEECLRDTASPGLFI